MAIEYTEMFTINVNIDWIYSQSTVTRSHVGLYISLTSNEVTGYIFYEYIIAITGP